jgi:hypothetical protein
MLAMLVMVTMLVMPIMLVMLVMLVMLIMVVMLIMLELLALVVLFWYGDEFGGLGDVVFVSDVGLNCYNVFINPGSYIVGGVSTVWW